MDGMLSQDEINALLSGLTDTAEPEPIEDDISFCKLLEKFLLKQTYVVTIAFTAAEAWVDI